VSQVARALYDQTGHELPHGVLYLDPMGVAALLQLSGPVDVPGLPEPLSAYNAEPLLSTEIYALYPESEQRDAVLNDAIDALFDALTARDLPGPRTVADALSPVVRGNHLSFSVADQQGEEFLEELGATGSFPPAVEGTDLLAVKTANAAPNKVDTYLRRDIAYEIEIDPTTGAVDATVRVTLVNEAPASGLPPVVGTNRQLIQGRRFASAPGTAIMTLALWSPLQVTEVTDTGFPTAVEMQQEFDQRVYSARVTIPPGQFRVLEYRLTGRVDLPYELTIDHQGLSRDDDLTVTLTTPDGWDPEGLVGFEEQDDRLVWAGVLSEDRRLEADFAKS
jgi:hypothetical protein